MTSYVLAFGENAGRLPHGVAADFIPISERSKENIHLDCKIQPVRDQEKAKTSFALVLQQLTKA